jgi:hypothetical protein
MNKADLDYYQQFLVTDVKTVDEFLTKYYKYADDKAALAKATRKANKDIAESGITDLISMDSMTRKPVAFKPDTETE